MQQFLYEHAHVAHRKSQVTRFSHVKVCGTAQRTCGTLIYSFQLLK
jgi:hypothetical protein